MPRAKFHTLTEQMFYVLLCLRKECYGMDILERVPAMTNGRVNVGSGTLYNLLEQFLEEEMIRETKVEGRKRSYLITSNGKKLLENELVRLHNMILETENYLNSIPLKRLGKPQDVANLAAFLADEASDYITGEIIRVDGGLAI